MAAPPASVNATPGLLNSLLIEQAPVAIAMLDRDMRYVAASKRWLADDGLAHENIIGRSHYEVFPDIPERWKEVHRRGVAGATVREEQDPFVRVDGHTQWLRWEVRPWHGADGSIGGILIISEDVTARVEAEQALRASEARLRAIVETAVDAIIVIDEAGCVQSMNPAAERIFGYAGSEVVGSNVAMLMPEPDRSAHDGYIAAYCRTGIARIIGIGREVQGRRKDGSIFPADLAVAEWRVDGKRFFTGIIRDVTLRKERESHVRLIMRELSHRTKNALAVVQAMAWQTANGTRDVEEFQERLSQRVDGLRRSIDLLVKSEWEGISLRELVDAQLLHFLDDPLARLLMEGPELVLQPNGAQDLGLVLHELATNASKYGALSMPGGRVLISWALERVPAGVARFRLSWQEEEGPLIEVPIRPGFGTTLIRESMAKTYKAKVSLDIGASGLVWVMDMEAARILRELPRPKEQDVVTI